MRYEDLATLSLDTLIQRRRDEVSIGLASAEEQAALAGPVDDDPARDTLDEWRLVAIRSRRSEVLLLGEARRAGTTWITSEVIAVDPGGRRLRTHSGSVYHLGWPGIGEPPLQHVLLVAWSLWSQAPKACAALGIPEVSMA
jgi:hypothetical protein